MIAPPSNVIGAGYAAEDITPPDGLTLCGFAARCNRPSDGVADPLTVHALALELADGPALLLVYDLLGLGPEAVEAIQSALDGLCPADLSRARRILVCTHTHSAPAAVKLIGCGVEEPDYRALLAGRSATAAQAALAGRRPAHLREWTTVLPGYNYNRHIVLDDGRVVMTHDGIAAVRKVGPVMDEFSFLRFESVTGSPIVGVVHWAAHALTAAGTKVSGDFPAEFCRRLAEREGYPFVYLQGACADLNPTFHKLTRDEMLNNVRAVMRDLPACRWSEPLALEPARLDGWIEPLSYQAAMSDAAKAAFREAMQLIAATGGGPAAARRMLSNILNTEPGRDPDPAMLRYIAGILECWCGQTRARPGDAAETFPLGIHLLRLGPLVLCFIGAEIFAETDRQLKARAQGLHFLTVGYAGPLAGYLPPEEALDEGGYEAEYAFMFYGHPAPFSRGSVPRVVQAVGRRLADQKTPSRA